MIAPHADTHAVIDSSFQRERQRQFHTLAFAAIQYDETHQAGIGQRARLGDYKLGPIVVLDIRGTEGPVHALALDLTHELHLVVGKRCGWLPEAKRGRPNMPPIRDPIRSSGLEAFPITQAGAKIVP